MFESREEGKMDFDFEEVSVVCSNCNKEMKIIAYKDTDLSEYLCPRCCAGEPIDDDESGF